MVKKETSCRVTDAILKYVRAERGDLGDLLEDFPFDEAYLSDTSNWVPLAASNELFERMRRMFNDPHITYKVGCASARLGAGGIIGRIARLLGSPRFIISQAPRLQAQLTTTSVLHIRELSDSSAVVEIRFKEGVEDVDRDSCDYARGVLASIPDFCGLGLAEIWESECYIPIHEKGIINGHFYRLDAEGNVLEYEEGADEKKVEGKVIGRLNEDGSFLLGRTLYGAPACVYHLSWKMPKKRWWETFFRKLGFTQEAILSRDAAINELMAANQDMERKSEELALINQELKDKSSQLALMNEELQKKTAELALTNEELKRRSEQLTLLNKVSQEITANLNLEALFQKVAESIQRNFQCLHVTVFTFDPSCNEVVLQASAGRYSRVWPRGYRQRAEQGIFGWVIRHGRKQLISDMNVALLHGDEFAETKAELCLPIRLGSETIGVLDVHLSQKEALNENYIDIMETLASQTAVAIRNAQLYTEVKEATRFKTEFLTNMSHELRTPLNTIIGFSELLLSGKTDGALQPGQREDVEKILRSAKHLLQLINDLLDISKIEAGKLELWKEKFHLQEILEDIPSTMQTLIGDSPIVYRQEVSEDLPLLYADKLRIKQVILNLLSNAVKFTERGNIILEAISLGKEVQISVTDTGIGIAKEDVSRLFEAFRQLDGSTTRRAKGTGLGLAISKSFVEMHGGRIWAESPGPSKGSTFHFTLPVAEVPAFLEEEQLLREKLVAAASALPIEPATGGNWLILAIDDDPEVIDLLQRSLGKEGYQVVGALDSREGVRLARELCPAAITLDILMPDVDGWEVLRELKSSPETADIPVIVVSILDNLERGFSLGAADYIIKPIDTGFLLNKLRRLTGKRVLVVDDDREVVEAVSRTLQAEGYIVEGAYGGKTALQKVEVFRPQVMILDLIMPDPDGFEIITKLHPRLSASELAIIILTAKELTQEDKCFLNNKVQKVIEKGSFSQKEILKEVKETLDKLIGFQETTATTQETEPCEVERSGVYNILVVEDEQQNIELIKRVLKDAEEFECQVWVVRDGKEALDFLYHQGTYGRTQPPPRPDLILMDMLMPQVSGYELAREIKSDPDLCDIPIVAVTAAALPHQLEKARAAGCDQQIVKPFGPAELIEKIKSLLNKV